ncbi:hypothetical protein Poli38472_001388 [Pythium oligandrum]|uniref:COMM domain-containing protein n=1 Tax=Pythium oligandrum TaxID=41045 RepID=A0A8K1CSS9_PYTOL|nr:hypothetical protein Poli38472_001388 [Pythium oligandrum]|eukprot:TMW69232.1 hypothetical protein Poli38472_001388 [Pythium oligandrum]
MRGTITWDERVVDALAAAKGLSIEQFESISKMAVLIFHAEKQNKRRLTRTASACGWSPEQTESLVLAIAKILMDASKTEASESQLEASLKSMSLVQEQTGVLTKLYADHREMIHRNSCRDTQSTVPQYQSFNWRVDLEIANRMSRNRPEPVVTLGLHTLTPSGEDQFGVPRHETTCMRVDFHTLKKLQQQMELALHEADSVHSSRMQRYLH